MKKGEYRTYVEEKTNEENVGKGHSTILLYLQNRGSNTKNKKNLSKLRIFCSPAFLEEFYVPACLLHGFVFFISIWQKISSLHRKIKTEINTWNLNSKSRRVSYTANEEQDEDRMRDHKREASRDSSLFSKHFIFFYLNNFHPLVDEWEKKSLKILFLFNLFFLFIYFHHHHLLENSYFFSFHVCNSQIFILFFLLFIMTIHNLIYLLNFTLFVVYFNQKNNRDNDDERKKIIP